MSRVMAGLLWLVSALMTLYAALELLAKGDFQLGVLGTLLGTGFLTCAVVFLLDLDKEKSDAATRRP